MIERSVKLGGFRLSVEVPDEVRHVIGKITRGRALRHRGEPVAPGESRLIRRDPPPAEFIRRDPEAGLGFIQHRIDQRTAGAAEAGSDFDDDDPAAVARQVKAHPWYHTIELPHGIVTPGHYDHRALVPSYGLPVDLKGKRALDIGAADGFWAFELERRGAKVTALDIESTAEVDLPGTVQRLAAERGLDDPLGDSFQLAHRLLKSEVERTPGSVYHLDPDHLGRFDLVHCGDLLLHVREPTRALEQIRSVTSGVAHISDVFDPSIGWPDRDESGLSRYLGGWVSAGWWTPALGTLVQMVADAGFSGIDIVTVYSLVPRWTAEGPWRAVLRARP